MDKTSPAKPKATRLYHLRVEGDLDCSALVGAFGTRLHDAAAKKCGVIILEPFR